MSSSTKYKVVLDTNVFISGLVYGGNSEKILRLFKDDQIELLISPQTHAEVLLKLPKFPLTNNYINEQDALIQAKATKVVPKKKVRVSRDPKDNMFLELAQEGKAKYLITGDKDLLTLKSFRGTLIVTPKEFLEMVEGKK